MTVQVLTGDCRDVLPTLAERSVQCVVTSPPYFGLRCYLPAGHPDAEREIGQEQTPAAYVEALVAVFREVRRVLRDDGTLWLNIAPSYAGNRSYPVPDSKWCDVGNERGMKAAELGYKPKDMIPTPWLVGIALQQDGWYLRAPIIWHKPNAMPSSVTDRPTLDYEYVLLLSKQERYFYDAVAIADPIVKGAAGSTFTHGKTGINGMGRVGQGERAEGTTRNARMVWSITTTGWSSGHDVDHFAVMPEKLVERCLLAATSPRACPTCRAPWPRVVERTAADDRTVLRLRNVGGRTDGYTRTRASGGLPPTAQETTGWRPTCPCPDNDGSGRCVVLDCFSGSGTTLAVATKHGRDAIGIDLNAAYVPLMEDRQDGIQLSLESVVL